MGKTFSKKNPIAKIFRKLIEARWFFAMSASGVASIIGISLTFGINSCRENQRVRAELHKSMLQAADNIQERFEDAQQWIAIIDNQNKVYKKADSILVAGGELPDSLCIEFRGTMPYIKISAFDHEFEKIFRGSYQLWQLQNSNDRLAYYIGQCYDGLNTVESTCLDLTESMLEMIGTVNATENFYRQPPRQWTISLLNNAKFQYYMSVRRVKSAIAADILRQAKHDYDENVVWRTNKLRKK